MHKFQVTVYKMASKKIKSCCIWFLLSLKIEIIFYWQNNFNIKMHRQKNNKIKMKTIHESWPSMKNTKRKIMNWKKTFYWSILCTVAFIFHVIRMTKLILSVLLTGSRLVLIWSHTWMPNRDLPLYLLIALWAANDN